LLGLKALERFAIFGDAPITRQRRRSRTAADTEFIPSHIRLSGVLGDHLKTGHL
jgi:hypothetical protein